MQGPPPKVDFCLRCGEYLREGVTYCPKCGERVPGAPTSAAPASSPGPRPSGRKLTWAGILLILAGLVGFNMAFFVTSNQEAIIEQALQIYPAPVADLEAAILAMAGFWVFAGVMSMVGGVCCIKRRLFPAALVGAFLAIFTGGFLLEGTIFGIIALVVLLSSRREFK